MALGFASPAGLVEESKESNGEKGNAGIILSCACEG